MGDARLGLDALGDVGAQAPEAGEAPLRIVMRPSRQPPVAQRILDHQRYRQVAKILARRQMVEEGLVDLALKGRAEESVEARALDLAGRSAGDLGETLG